MTESNTASSQAPGPDLDSAEPAAARPHLAAEVATQPENWSRMRSLAADAGELLGRPGERIAIFGCGSSLYVAHAVARLRERAGLGHTDPWPGGDPLFTRDYDRVIGISRSGTTTEVLRTLAEFRSRFPNTPVTVITATPDSPITELGEVLSLAELDEQSVVQSRLVTSTIALFRWHFGEDLAPAIEQAREVLGLNPADFDDLRDAEQITFVGQDWAFGIAEEASLKLKESTQSWTESYQMTEYRHGPISIAAPGRVVWALGELIDGLREDVTATGAKLVDSGRDPIAELVAVQRLCLLRAAARGLDPDQPRSLSRSIILG